MTDTAPPESTVPPPLPEDVAIFVREWDKPWKGPMLLAFARVLNETQACRIVGIARSTNQLGRKEDPAYEAAWQESRAIGVDLLAQVAHRRATTGEPERITRTKRVRDEHGNVIGEEVVVTEQTTVDNSMLRWLLSRQDPRRFGDRTELLVAGDPERPVQVEIYREPTPERRLELAQLAIEMGTPSPPVTGETIDGNGYLLAETTDEPSAVVEPDDGMHDEDDLADEHSGGEQDEE